MCLIIFFYFLCFNVCLHYPENRTDRITFIWISTDFCFELAENLESEKTFNKRLISREANKNSPLDLSVSWKPHHMICNNRKNVFYLFYGQNQKSQQWHEFTHKIKKVNRIFRWQKHFWRFVLILISLCSDTFQILQ